MVRTMRAIDREAKRAERQQLAYEKAALKQELLEEAAAAVGEYESLIHRLTRAHQVPLRPRDWSSIALATEPAAPAMDDTHERRARRKQDEYSPGWLDRTFGGEKRKRAALERDIEAGIAQDKRLFGEREREFTRRKAEIALARRIIELDHEAVVDALDDYTQLGNLPFSVEGIDVLFTDDDRVIALVDGLDLEDIPDQSLPLLQSGKVSTKQLSQSKILELHRINICSSAMRVAMEFLNALPLKAVEVVMQSDILDRATGHIEACPVLYVRVAAQALGSINLERTEADALVERLGGHLDFSRKEGFRPLNLAPFNIPTDRVVEE